MAIKITQKTFDFDGEPETIFSANGCSIVYAVYVKYNGYDKPYGYKVMSFCGADIGVIVDSGKSWSDVRTKARKYIKANAQRHFDHHGIYPVKAAI